MVLSVWQPVDDSSMTLARQMEWTLQRKARRIPPHVPTATPPQNPFGPSTMECNQSQRLSLYRDHHVVLQTELVRLCHTWSMHICMYAQSVPAVPYGDYFVVCARWDVQPADKPGHFSWKHSAWVSFIKVCVAHCEIPLHTLMHRTPCSSGRL